MTADVREMTQQQYEVLCAARRRSGAVSLAQLSRGARRYQARAGKVVPTPVGKVVALAAERLRRRELAEAAWERLASRAWADETAVEGTDDAGTVTIVVTSSPVLCELKRRQGALEQGFARLVPGIRQVRFRVGGRAGGRTSP